MAYTRIIENLVLTSTLRLEGEEWNNTLIRNVTISNVDGDGILLRNVSNVRIENVTITNVTGTGIKLSTQGSTSNVEIVDSTITKTGKDGISAGERDGVDHIGLKIIGNTISDTGLSGNGDGLMHGIYVQSSEFLIEGNIILNSMDGNAISVRSSGIVRDNYIEGAQKSGISYYADHDAGTSEQLIIEHNVIVDTGLSGSRGDINILNIPTGLQGNVVDSIIVRDNYLTGLKAVIIDPSYAAKGFSVVTDDNLLVKEDYARTLRPDDKVEGSWSDPVLQTRNAGFDLDPGLSGRSTLDLMLDDAQLSTSSLGRQTTSVGNLDAISTQLTAMKGAQGASVGIASGKIGVASSGESTTAASAISGTEALIINFKTANGLGDAVDVTLDLSKMSNADTAIIDIYRDGVLVGSQTTSASHVTVSNADGFDTLVLHATGSGISLTGMESERFVDLDSWYV